MSRGSKRRLEQTGKDDFDAGDQAAGRRGHIEDGAGARKGSALSQVVYSLWRLGSNLFGAGPSSSRLPPPHGGADPQPSRTTETAEQKRARDAERKKRNRAAETPEQSHLRQERDKKRRYSARLHETPEKSSERRRMDAARHTMARTEETPEKSRERRRVDAAMHTMASK